MIRVDVPEDPVHDIKGGIAHAGTRIDRDQSTRPAIQHVAGVQIPVQERPFPIVDGQLACQLASLARAAQAGRPVGPSSRDSVLSSGRR